MSTDWGAPPTGGGWGTADVAPAAPAAGWFEDPWRRAALRWWDGRIWTPFTDVEPVAPGRPAVTVASVGPSGLVGLLIVAMVLGATLLTRWSDVGAGWPVPLDSIVLCTAPFVAAVVASRRWGTGDPGVDLGLRFRLGDVLMAVQVALMVPLLALIGSLITIVATPDRIGTSLALDLGLRHESAAGLALIFAVVGVLQPVSFELLLRGLIGRGLVAYIGPRWANVVQIAASVAIAVAASGRPLLGVGIGAGLGAAFCGWVALRTERLGATMLGQVAVALYVLVHAQSPF